MEIALIATAAMTILSPLLTKASEKAAEKIGEKLADKATEKGLWQKIRDLFIVTGDQQMIEQIENKLVATQSELNDMEVKLVQKLASNPEFGSEIQAFLNLSSTNAFIAGQLLRSIQADRARLEELFEERRNAGLGPEGDFNNLIAQTRRRMEKDEKDFIKLVTGT